MSTDLIRSDQPYSAPEAQRFLEMVEQKGLMKSATARARKTAVERVLSVTDPEERLDLRKLDVEGVVRRFANKYSGAFHPDSLDTYAHRFKAALADFIAWVDNPMGFRPSTVQRQARQTRGVEETLKPEMKAEATVERPETTAPPAMLGLIGIAVPLPSGPVAQLYVPRKVTAADAERIAAFAKALVVGQKED